MRKYSIFLSTVFVILVIFLFFSCKEYEFTSPYDTQNNLAAPTELSLIFYADTAVTLNWQFTFVEEFKYALEVELSEDGSNYYLIQLIKENVNAVTIPKEFTVGQEYYFRMRAKVDNNLSGYSNVVNKLITFNAPGDVTAQLPTDTVAIIQWQDNAEIETGYEIFMSIDGGISELIKEVPANTTQTEYLSDFSSGKTYIFSVRAKSRASGVTAFSSANTQFNLMQVTGLIVAIPDTTTAILSWTKTNGYARDIVIEKSIDGSNFILAKRISPDSNGTTILGDYSYIANHYFRIKTQTKNNFGSVIVDTAVNMGIIWIIVQNGPTGNFYMSETEVTFDQYDYFCEQTGRTKPPANFGRGKQPVINVNVADAVAFCNWLGQQTGYNIRLPNENEWEFAARGGIYTHGYTYSGSNDLDLVGWYDGNSNGTTHAVKGQLSNELGLYDMSGNVLEWTSTSTGSHQVIRGGSWSYSSQYCTVSYSSISSPANRLTNVGFRIFRSP